MLGLADCGRWFERNAEVDRGTVGDTTLDTTGVVCLRCEALLRRVLGAQLGLYFGGNEGVIVD